MTNITFKKGDILKAFEKKEFDILCHQENCEGLSYFSGIAKSIHNLYPELTKLHVEFCRNKPPTNNYDFKEDKFHDRIGNKWYWLDNLVFENYLEYKVNEQQSIINLYAQIFRSSSSLSKKGMFDAFKYPDVETEELAVGTIDIVTDSLKNRKFALSEILEAVNHNYKGKSIGLPLIASGLAATKSIKQDMSDLEYFKLMIYPIVEEKLKDVKVTIYYL